MSNKNPLKAGDKVAIVKGRNAGLIATVRYTADKSFDATSGSMCIGMILNSSVSPASIRKAVRDRKLAEINASYPATAHVTWAWLTETMTAAEADAWLGLD